MSSKTAAGLLVSLLPNNTSALLHQGTVIPIGDFLSCLCYADDAGE
jgi:hypothetical protein